MDNAITRECDAVVYVMKEDIEELMDLCSQLESIFNDEYSSSEDGIHVIADVDGYEHTKVMDEKSANNIIYALNMVPYGVIRISPEMNGLVESSNNPGIVKTDENYFEIVNAVRSSVATVKYDIMEKLAMIAEMTEGKLAVRSQYPGWQFKKNSPLRDICSEAYKEMFGKEPEIQAIHAGLECGLLSAKAPDMDMISIGPEMYDVHTPSERISISSVERTWNFIKHILKKLK